MVVRFGPEALEREISDDGMASTGHPGASENCQAYEEVLG